MFCTSESPVGGWPRQVPKASRPGTERPQVSSSGRTMSRSVDQLDHRDPRRSQPSRDAGDVDLQPGDGQQDDHRRDRERKPVSPAASAHLRGPADRRATLARSYGPIARGERWTGLITRLLPRARRCGRSRISPIVYVEGERCPEPSLPNLHWLGSRLAIMTLTTGLASVWAGSVLIVRTRRRPRIRSWRTSTATGSATWPFSPPRSTARCRTGPFGR